MAYDSNRSLTVFFGGEIGLTGEEEFFDETWEYDRTAWRKITIAGLKPDPRSFHAMCYDSIRKEVLLGCDLRHTCAVSDRPPMKSATPPLITDADDGFDHTGLRL